MEVGIRKSNSTTTQETPTPKDVPSKASPALKALNALVGEWSVQASHVALPGVNIRGTTTFEWLEGERFLIQRARIEGHEIPGSISIIGAGESGAALTSHYFDSRGVHRIYQMSLSNGNWQIWRDEPGFWQRFSGTLSADGMTIKGLFELSRDGVKYKPDLEQTYTRVKQKRG